MRAQLAIFGYALGALGRRKGKSAALALGLAALVLYVAATLLFVSALRAEFERGAEGLPDLTVQRLVAGRPALIEEGAAEAIAALPAVRSVRPRVWGYLFSTVLEANLTVVGVSPEGIEEVDGLGVAVGEGRGLRGARGEALVGRELAMQLGLRAGDRIQMPGVRGPVELSIVGLFDDRSALRTADLVLVSNEEARALLGVPAGQATDLAVALSTPDEAEVITGHIGAQIEGARVLDRRLLARTYELTFDARGGLMAATWIPALLAFLLLAWDRLSGLSAEERREIGILKAVGFTTSEVISARLFESLAIALTGALVGGLAAYAYVFLLGAPGLSHALLGWSRLYPPFALTPELDPASLFGVLAAAVVPFVALSVVPAWRAATLDPDEAMRGSR